MSFSGQIKNIYINFATSSLLLRMLLEHTLTKIQLVFLWLFCLFYTCAILICLNSYILFIFLLLLTLSFLVYILSCIGFYSKFNTLFASVFIQILTRYFWFFIITDFVLVDISLSLEIDGIYHMGIVPKITSQAQVSLPPSTLNPTTPAFMNMYKEFNSIIAVPSDFYIRGDKPKPCAFNRVFMSEAYNTYTGSKIKAIDATRIMTYSAKQGNIICNYSQIIDFMGGYGRWGLVHDYTQDSFHLKTMQYVDTSDIIQVSAANHLTLANFNLELIVGLAYTEKKYPGANVNFERGTEVYDLYGSLGEERFGMDICIPDTNSQKFRRLLDSLDYKTKRLKSDSDVIVLCDFRGEYTKLLKELPEKLLKRIELITPDDLQKLYLRYNLNADQQDNIHKTSPEYRPGGIVYLPDSLRKFTVDYDLGLEFFDKNR
jgi:hypothetical protein